MKLFWLLLILLAVPIVPALLVGARWDQQLSEAVVAAGDRQPVAVAVLVAGLLAADIFLPVPSGPLATIAGASLGPAAVAPVGGGLVLGAALGFWAARRCGRPIAVRLAGAEQLDRLAAAFQGREAWLLLLTRPLPVLAEATVLLAGLAGVPWRRFLGPVMAGNLLFAATLVVLGQYAVQNQALAVSVALSVLLPLLAASRLRKRLLLRSDRGE